MNNRYADALQHVGWFVLIFGIIGSFILGAVFPTYSGTYYNEESYNFTVTIIGIVSSIFIGLVLLGFSEIIELLSDIHVSLERLGNSIPEKEAVDSDELPDL